MSLEELKDLQVKITYVGPQDEPISTLIFATEEIYMDPKVFRPYHSAGIHYGNDDIAKEQIIVTPEELKAIIGTFKHVASRAIRGLPPSFISISLYNKVGEKEYIFEDILGFDESKEFFIYFRGALSENRDAQRTLQWWGCALGLLPPGIPAKDVTQQIQVETSGVIWNAKTQHYECTATLVNNSSEFFYSPISLVVDSYPWRLARYDGTTCETKPVGFFYIHIKTPSGGLAPHEKVSVPLEFEGPVGDGEPIKLTTKVLVGSGER